MRRGAHQCAYLRAAFVAELADDPRDAAWPEAAGPTLDEAARIQLTFDDNDSDWSDEPSCGDGILGCSSAPAHAGAEGSIGRLLTAVVLAAVLAYRAARHRRSHPS